MEILKNGLTYYLIWLWQHIRYYRRCRIDYMSRVEGSTLGRFTRLYRNVVFKHSTLGNYSYVGRDSHIQYAKIGMFCSIGSRVMIGGGLHPTDQFSTHPAMYNLDRKIDEIKPVTIGTDVWIGQGAIILDGVKIGNGAIIAAGSVVSHNVKKFAIVGGVPATTIGERKVKNESWYEAFQD